MKIYTTGYVSKLCHVSQTTVNKWFDTGELKGFRVPGSRHRRIPRESLIQFLERHGIPIDSLDLEQDAATGVLIVTRDQQLIEQLGRELARTKSIKITVATSAFDAGADTKSLHPECILLDFAIGSQQAEQICHNLRSKPVFADTILMAVLPIGTQLPVNNRNGIDETFLRPFDPKLLAERIRTLLGSRTNL